MKTKTILVIDDEINLLNLIKDQLELFGCKVIAHHDPQWVLDNVNFKEVDCIVSDIIMPNIDGVELVKRIQAKGFHPITFFITGYTDYPREELNRLKPRAIVFKPFDIEEISHLIADSIRPKK